MAGDPSSAGESAGEFKRVVQAAIFTGRALFEWARVMIWLPRGVHRLVLGSGFVQIGDGEVMSSWGPMASWRVMLGCGYHQRRRR